MTSRISKVHGSPSGIELAMTSPPGVQPVKEMVTLSWAPGDAAPFPFRSSFQPRPLSVLVASGGAAATSGGAGGAAGRGRPRGSTGWDAAIGLASRAARNVVTTRGGGRRGSIPAAYHGTERQGTIVTRTASKPNPADSSAHGA